MDRLDEINKLFTDLKKDMPKEITAFANFSMVVKESNKIDKKNKSLTMISLAVYAQCDWCIAIHIKSAVEVGATKDEIIESAMLAVLMGGGPKLMYMTVVYDELEKIFASK